MKGILHRPPVVCACVFVHACAYLTFQKKSSSSDVLSLGSLICKYNTTHISQVSDPVRPNLATGEGEEKVSLESADSPATTLATDHWPSCKNVKSRTELAVVSLPF